jgi:hypothetical protein
MVTHITQKIDKTKLCLLKMDGLVFLKLLCNFGSSHLDGQSKNRDKHIAVTKSNTK